MYPFPKDEVISVLQRFKNVEEIVWVQEEPKNMGAWLYMYPKLMEMAPEQASVLYIGRPERSSTAEGMADAHNIEQERIIREALTPTKQQIAETVSQGGGRQRD